MFCCRTIRSDTLLPEADTAAVKDNLSFKFIPVLLGVIMLKLETGLSPTHRNGAVALQQNFTDAFTVSVGAQNTKCRPTRWDSHIE